LSQKAIAKVIRVTLEVGDIDQPERFDTTLLGVTGQRIWPGRYAWDCAGTLLVFYHRKEEGQARYPIPSPNKPYLSVADVSEVFTRTTSLRALDLTKTLETGPERERCFTVKDSSRNPLCLIERTSKAQHLSAVPLAHQCREATKDREAMRIMRRNTNP
jgi:hypothetical protein